ncbi:MAG TPA: hypothetical protein VGY66_09235 [Gemmataceae bacterium]|nr:hypothetical protein [Gemmataceae bacterium]
MKRWLCLILSLALLVTLRPAFAEKMAEPSDGVYLVHLEGAGPKVMRNDDGDPLVLGERLADKFGQAVIESDSNDNSRFSLDLKGAGPFPPGHPGPMALLIGGRCFVVYSNSDPEPDGKRQLGSIIIGAEAMQVVAKKFKVEPRLRKHPGYQLLATWTPDQAGYKAGEPITLTLKIKNVGAQAAAFFDGGAQRGARNNQFGFTAFHSGKAVPDTGDPLNFGGKASLEVLEPGESFSKSVRLDDWFKFNEPGVYQITGTYKLAFYDPKSKPRRPLWTDFASGECSVRIVK